MSAILRFCNEPRPFCRFWALLSKHLSVRQLSSPLPFTSSFCQGFGTSFYSRGQVLKELLHLHAYNSMHSVIVGLLLYL